MNNESTNCNLVKKQERSVDSFVRQQVLFLAVLLTLVAKTPCLADDFTDVTEGSWLRTGLFCFRTSVGTNDQIHLVRYGNGKFEELFTRAMGRRAKPPICLTNGVAVVSVDGVIRRLDLKGEYVFTEKPKEFEGVAEDIGRLDDHRIFVTGSVFDKTENRWLHRLYLVNISGSRPVLTEKFDIIQPCTIAQTLDEIIVVGETNVQRLEIPKN